MRILLSAYACEPNRGSEPGVGWHWSLEIEKLGHQVYVLTRKNNKETIDCFWGKHEKPSGLHYIYYDVPSWLAWWKKGGRGVYLYYLLWQIGAFLKVRSIHKVCKFEKVQHITFASFRQPSFMGLLGVPFVFGPVGGGESAPYELRKRFSLKGWVKDFFRDAVNFFVKFDPFMHLTFFTSKEIFATSLQTKHLIPRFYQRKVKVCLAIGIDERMIQGRVLKENTNPSELKILYVGRFEYWKGMGLGIQAFVRHRQGNNYSTLTMVGSGPDELEWKSLANDLGVAQSISWIPWVDQSELPELYSKHDLFIFPSLHDSGGMVVLEAMANGLPVLCFNLGGPGQMVDHTCGNVINVFNSGENEVIQNLSDGLSSFRSNERGTLSTGARNKARLMSWKSIVAKVYGSI